jgi:hypothetical protein
MCVHSGVLRVVITVPAVTLISSRHSAPEAAFFDQVGLWLALQEPLWCEVDLLTDHPDAGRITEAAKREAIQV